MTHLQFSCSNSFYTSQEKISAYPFEPFTIDDIFPLVYRQIKKNLPNCSYSFGENSLLHLRIISKYGERREISLIGENFDDLTFLKIRHIILENGFSIKPRETFTEEFLEENLSSPNSNPTSV